MKFEKIKLPYDSNALEPFLDQATVEVHYNKHHTAYQDGINNAVSGTELENFNSIEEVLLNYGKLDDGLKTVVRNAGGGLFNHNFYWKQFVVNRELSETELSSLEKIKEQYGSLDEFKNEFVSKGLSVFGSGWVWLVENNGQLEIITTPNQENPLMNGIENILIGVDVWEHAYYLKYKNNRKEYLENILQLTFIK